MSEKRIRELAQQSVYESGLSGYIEEALAADPDVVAVAREFPELRGYLEQKFKFRLTDDGYEWTGEATDE